MELRMGHTLPTEKNLVWGRSVRWLSRVRRLRQHRSILWAFLCVSRSCQDPLSSPFRAGLQGAGCGSVMCPGTHSTGLFIMIFLGYCLPNSVYTGCAFVCHVCYQGQLEFKNQVDFVIDGDPWPIIRPPCPCGRTDVLKSGCLAVGLVGRQTLLWDPDLLEGLMTSSLMRNWPGSWGWAGAPGCRWCCCPW